VGCRQASSRSFSPVARKMKTATITRLRRLSVRLSAAEYSQLAAAATAAGTSPSTLLRDRALAALLHPLPSPHPLETSAGGLLTRRISSRLTAAEAEALGLRARECDLPVAAYVRHVLRGSTPSARRPAAREAVVALSRVGNNLNQLTRLAHGGTLIPADLFRAIEALRAEVYRVRSEILAADSEARP
jgi:hypothetical protein